MTIYYAHSRNDYEKWHPLKEHLASVSRLAGEYLAGWQGEEEGRLAGLLHDLGKYGDRFQNRLHGQDKGLDHWSQGAWIALKDYRAIAAALAIQGHHVGLQYLREEPLRQLEPDKLKIRHPLNLQLSETNPEILIQRFTEDQLQAQRPSKLLLGSITSRIDTMLNIRILFSALVDADYLDTEAHFNGNKNGKQYRTEGKPLYPEQALTILQEHINKLEANASSSATLATVRRQLQRDCLDSAEINPGLFTLTAPTGSGKTLAMLAFALAHAKAHKLRRVVMVIPYLSIIEQTAKVIRTLFEPYFGSDYILEHHSLAGGGQESRQSDSEEQQDRRRQQLAENWDAPIILTTNVQLLESLFSNRPSQCRKLHRLRKSVILFDEAQTLPIGLAVPTLAALSHLAYEHSSTVVFSTATQPAFSHLHDYVKKQCSRGWQPIEIVKNPAQLFMPLARTRYHWHSPQQRWSWDYLTEQLKPHHQALCIVNLKRHAKVILETLDDISILHLSTNQCPAHRADVLTQVREALQNNQPCTLIATQCIEAGVDIDFPIVYRSYAPLDAIIQAAGRCNREGKLENGDVHIFCPEDEKYPLGGGYQQAAEVTKELLNRLGNEAMQMHHPEFITQYYRSLYDLSQPQATKDSRNLTELITAGAFPEIASAYRLIKQDTINVVVPYEPQIELYQALDESKDSEGLNRKWIQKARPLTVSLYRPKPDDTIWDSLIPVPVLKKGKRQETDDWFMYSRKEHYHHLLGLCPPNQLNLWIA